MTCSDRLQEIARFNNNGGQRCSLDADYSWVVATTPPSAASMTKTCQSDACKQLIAALKGAMPRECAHKAMGSPTELQLYAQILDPIDATCNSAAQPTTTTPAPASPATTRPSTPSVTTPTMTTATPTPTPSVTPDDSTDTTSNL